MSPDAPARCRFFCGIFLMVTSRPFFLKIPAWLASVSGAKPVHPEIPMATLVSSAKAGAETRRAAVSPNIPKIHIGVFLFLGDGLPSSLSVHNPANKLVHLGVLLWASFRIGIPLCRLFRGP